MFAKGLGDDVNRDGNQSRKAETKKTNPMKYGVPKPNQYDKNLERAKLDASKTIDNKLDKMENIMDNDNTCSRKQLKNDPIGAPKRGFYSEKDGYLS